MIMKIKNKEEVKGMLKKLVLLSLLTLIISTFLISIVSAPPPTKLSVDPSKTSGLKVGDTFTVQVKVSKVTDLVLFDLKLGYDTSVLEIVSSTVTPPSAWGSNYLTFRSGVDRATSSYWVIVAKTGNANPFAGSTSLATVTFEVIGSGASTLDLHDTWLVNSQFQDISHDVNDGSFGTSKGRGRGRLDILDALVEFFSNFFGGFL